MLEDSHSSIFLFQLSKLVYVFVMSGFYICLNVADIYDY